MGPTNTSGSGKQCSVSHPSCYAWLILREGKGLMSSSPASNRFVSLHLPSSGGLICCQTQLTLLWQEHNLLSGARGSTPCTICQNHQQGEPKHCLRFLGREWIRSLITQANTIGLRSKSMLDCFLGVKQGFSVSIWLGQGGYCQKDLVLLCHPFPSCLKRIGFSLNFLSVPIGCFLTGGFHNIMSRIHGRQLRKFKELTTCVIP